jgi:hypothetical protein
MNESHPRTALADALHDHHRLLEIQTRLVERFADGSCPAFKTWILDVRRDLEALGDLLDTHFAHEETERLHDEIAAALPNSGHRLETLLKEHRTILSRCDALREQAVRTEKPGEDFPLRNEASEFFALLDGHERAERELFLQALEGDGGSPD